MKGAVGNAGALAMAKTLKMMSEPPHILTNLTFRRKCQIHNTIAVSTAQSDELHSDVETSGCFPDSRRCTQGARDYLCHWRLHRANSIFMLPWLMHECMACCSLTRRVNGKTKAACRGPDGAAGIPDMPSKESASCDA